MENKDLNLPEIRVYQQHDKNRVTIHHRFLMMANEQFQEDKSYDMKYGTKFALERMNQKLYACGLFEKGQLDVQSLFEVFELC